MKYFFKNKIKLAVIGVIVLLIGILVCCIKLDNNKQIEEVITINDIKKETKIKEEKKYIDIKGSVNNPGVYEFKENDRVIDAIELAGGLTNDANTSNINLSQKLQSEMVIYVYNNNEIKNETPKLSCDTVNRSK